MGEPIPVGDSDVVAMLRENPNLKFTINVEPTAYTIRLTGKKETYVLYTARNVLKEFAMSDTVFKWLRQIGATNIDVCMRP